MSTSLRRSAWRIFAMVAEFGYTVALMRSGLLIREQFFRPTRFHPALPLRSQMLLGGSMPVTSPDAPMWAKPFSFGFARQRVCTVAARNFGVLVPISRDPREPIATHLRIAPAKYKLRPDFRTRNAQRVRVRNTPNRSSLPPLRSRKRIPLAQKHG
jgi:hypothetical protein